MPIELNVVHYKSRVKKNGSFNAEHTFKHAWFDNYLIFWGHYIMTTPKFN